MDSPQSKSSSRPRHSSRLSQTRSALRDEEPSGLTMETMPVPVVQTSSPLISPSTKSVTTRQELVVVLSPASSKRSRGRLVDRFDKADELGAELKGHRKRNSKIKSVQGGCDSPRSSIGRRVRRRSEKLDGCDSRDDRELVEVLMEELGKVRRRKRRQEKKEKIPEAPIPKIPLTSTKVDEDVDKADGCNLDAMGAVIYDLIMWKDAAKTTLWFGIGSLYFLSSSFAKGVNFSIVSFMSQIGILLLGASFISNCFSQRINPPRHEKIMLKDEDILKICRWCLPAVNFILTYTKEIFSGEPSTTLKAIPFFLMGAEYGHLLTLRRLLAAGFFASFTLPILYSRYATGIEQKVERSKERIVEAWKAFSHKKIVSISTVLVIWNLCSIRTRFLIGFIFFVLVRCFGINLLPKQDSKTSSETEQELEKALVIAQQPCT